MSAHGAAVSSPLASENRSLRATNRALAATNSDLARSQAALTQQNAAQAAEVQQLRAQLATVAASAPSVIPLPVAVPAPGPAEATSFPSLPLAVMTSILALLSNPRDVFAFARSCRTGRNASRCRGAFLSVSLSALEDDCTDRRCATAQFNLETHRGDRATFLASYAPDSVRAAAFATFLARTEAGAGITTLILTHPRGAVVPPQIVAALVRRCASSLTRLLLDIHFTTRTPMHNVAAAYALGEAQQSPLEHLRMRSTHICMVPKRLALTLPSLHVYCATDGDQETILDGSHPGGTIAPGLVAAFLASAPSLTKLMLHGQYRMGFNIASLSLKSLTLRGKEAHLTVCNCPHLRDLELRDTWSNLVGWDHMRPILLGCPAFDWYSPVTCFVGTVESGAWTPSSRSGPDPLQPQHVASWRAFVLAGASAPEMEAHVAKVGEACGTSAAFLGALRFSSVRVVDGCLTSID